MRTQFIGDFLAKELLDELRGSLPSQADVRLALDRPKNIVILAGKEPHCLGDLLLRHCNGELTANLVAVISNHSDLQALVARFGIPFYHVPCINEDRDEHEHRLLAILQAFRPDCIVLAKYMRVLTKRVVDLYPNRILNIHHSFLPAFAGAHPYRQAYNRGVKVIGATAHFVTETLDDGPIVTQSVIPVTHAHTSKSMAQEGREIEKWVLARALQLVLDDRVFVSGNRTIIFQ